MDKSKNLAKVNNISVNEVLQNYMFERILERLYVSKALTERVEHLEILKNKLENLNLNIPIVIYKGNMGKKNLKRLIL